MKPSLQFRLSQHLTLTPQLQQSIRLLQLSTVELNQEIERLLMDNPALEREDHEHDDADAAPTPQGGTASSSATTEAPPAPDTDWSVDVAANWRSGGDDEEGERTFTPPDLPTLRDHLRSQLTLTKLGERDRALVGELIDALDEDGYLTQSLQEILALLPPEAEVDLEELSIALQQLRESEHRVEWRA
jgi:RNA polymerase sigma-54 factor